MKSKLIELSRGIKTAKVKEARKFDLVDAFQIGDDVDTNGNFAVNISKMNGNEVAQIGLWLSENKDGPVTHWPKDLNGLQCSHLQRLGFIDSKIVTSRYRHDMFALFSRFRWLSLLRQ